MVETQSLATASTSTVIALSTSRGKGVGFVIPNLLHFTGSGIILDVKGGNFAKTSVHRQHGLKNAIWYFSPFDDEHGSHRFNPLARIPDIEFRQPRSV